jgi:hypothetical protein
MNNQDKLNELANLAKGFGFPVEKTDTSVKVIVADGIATGECFITARISTGSRFDPKPARVVYSQRITRTSRLNRKSALEAVESWAV